MSDLGRILITLGLVLVVIGILFVIFTRMNVPLGRLPGDFTWRGRNWTVSIPLATSVLLSVVLSLILWAINHFRR